MKVILGARQTGRTTALLEAAYAAKRIGHRVVIVVASIERKNRLLELTKEQNGKAAHLRIEPKELRTYTEVRESRGTVLGAPKNSNGPLLFVDDLDTMMYVMFYGKKPDVVTMENDGLALLPPMDAAADPAAEGELAD